MFLSCCILFGGIKVAKHSGTTVYNDRQNAYKLPYWTPENPTNEWARIDSSTGGNSFSVYRKKSFIRLDNISVGYNVPSRWITKLGLGSLRVYANVRNVAVWILNFGIRKIVVLLLVRILLVLM